MEGLNATSKIISIINQVGTVKAITPNRSCHHSRPVESVPVRQNSTNMSILLSPIVLVLACTAMIKEHIRARSIIPLSVWFA